jgi:hypothetical protein
MTSIKKGSVFIISITPVANGSNIPVQNGREEAIFSLTF